jgi:hypothetical protein
MRRASEFIKSFGAAVGFSLSDAVGGIEEGARRRIDEQETR